MSVKKEISTAGHTGWTEDALTQKHKPRVIRQLGENDKHTPRKNMWTVDMDRTFREQWLRGVSIPQIAYTLGKSEKAIKARRYYVGLPPRKYAANQRRNYLRVALTDAEIKGARRRAMERQQSPSAYILYLIQRDIS